MSKEQNTQPSAGNLATETKESIDSFGNSGAESPTTAPTFASPVAQSTDSSPTRIGNFRLDKLIGRGGMGNVFLAYDEQLRRKVAIKFPRVDTHHQPQLAKQFLREARLAARLNHPNLVKIYEVDVSNESCYIASEWCDGGDLASWLAEHSGPRDPRWSAQVMLPIIQAVAHCHSHSIVHLDIKPANIILKKLQSETDEIARSAYRLADQLVTDAQLPHLESSASFESECQIRPMLTDFGVARVIEEGLTKTHSSMLMGTPMYMSPEQAECNREQIGPASDIFAIGVVLHELVYGRHPFKAESPIQVLDQIRSADTLVIPKTDRVPQDLRTICERCMQYSPNDRYLSADDLVSDLNRFLRGEPILARPISILQRLQRWCLRPQRISEALTTVFVVQLVLGFWTLLGIMGAAKIVSGEELTSSRIQLLSTIVFMSLPICAFAHWAARGSSWSLRLAFAIGLLGQTIVPTIAILGFVDLMGPIYTPYPFFKVVNLGLVMICGFTQTCMLGIAILADRKRISSR